MARTPTGNPRGRPKGSGLLLGEEQTRLTIRIPRALYEALEERAATLHFTRGAPELARTVREALAHYLTCTHKGQTRNIPGPEAAPLSRQTEHAPLSTPSLSPDPDTKICLPENKPSMNIRQTENGTHDGATIGQTQHEVPCFDPSKYVLGKLCPRGHRCGDTGQSLLRIANLGCLACDKERARERRQAKRQAIPDGTRA